MKVSPAIKEILFESTIDLSEDRAYEFYQKCRYHVQDELVARFKKEYKSAFYSKKLLEDTKTHGSDETVGTYLAVMSKYLQW